MYLLQNGKNGTAHEKVAELTKLLAESKSIEASETRWAAQYKAERDESNAKLAKMIHPSELREKVEIIRRKQDYWRSGPAALDALMAMITP